MTADPTEDVDGLIERADRDLFHARSQHGYRALGHWAEHHGPSLILALQSLKARAEAAEARVTALTTERGSLRSEAAALDRLASSGEYSASEEAIFRSAANELHGLHVRVIALQAQISEAWNELHCCDDVKLDGSLTEVIGYLHAERDAQRTRATALQAEKADLTDKLKWTLQNYDAEVNAVRKLTKERDALQAVVEAGERLFCKLYAWIEKLPIPTHGATARQIDIDAYLTNLRAAIRACWAQCSPPSPDQKGKASNEQSQARS